MHVWRKVVHKPEFHTLTIISEYMAQKAHRVTITIATADTTKGVEVVVVVYPTPSE